MRCRLRGRPLIRSMICASRDNHQRRTGAAEPSRQFHAGTCWLNFTLRHHHLCEFMQNQADNLFRLWHLMYVCHLSTSYRTHPTEPKPSPEKGINHNHRFIKSNPSSSPVQPLITSHNVTMQQGDRTRRRSLLRQRQPTRPQSRAAA